MAEEAHRGLGLISHHDHRPQAALNNHICSWSINCLPPRQLFNTTFSLETSPLQPSSFLRMALLWLHWENGHNQKWTFITFHTSVFVSKTSLRVSLNSIIPRWGQPLHALSPSPLRFSMLTPISFIFHLCWISPYHQYRNLGWIPPCPRQPEEKSLLIPFFIHVLVML